MQHHGAAREDLIVAPAHDHQKREEKQHQQRRPFAQPRLAQAVIDQPADGQRGGGNRDALPDRKIGLGRVDQVKLRPHPVDEDQHRRTGQPCRIAFPLEPCQVFGHRLGRDEVLANVVEAAAMHLPFLAIGGAGNVAVEAEVERDEIEARPDPRDRGDHVHPANREFHPVPDRQKILHPTVPAWPYPSTYPYRNAVFAGIARNTRSVSKIG